MSTNNLKIDLKIIRDKRLKREGFIIYVVSGGTRQSYETSDGRTDKKIWDIS